jgi:hypothetical protein
VPVLIEMGELYQPVLKPTERIGYLRVAQVISNLFQKLTLLALARLYRCTGDDQSQSEETDLSSIRSH